MCKVCGIPGPVMESRHTEGGPGRCFTCQARYSDSMRFQREIIAHFAYADRRFGTRLVDGLTVHEPTIEDERAWLATGS